MKTIEQKLNERLVENSNGCVEWTGHKMRYGYVRINGKIQKTHRLAWELKNGEITDGLFVLHKCDNPACCNVDHLFLGTQKDNMQDALKKGRLKFPHCPPEKKARGTRNGMWIHRHKFTGSDNNNAKLNDGQRDELCELKRTGITAKELSEKFNISESQVLRIARSRGIKQRPLKWTDSQRESIMASRKKNKLIALYGSKQQ
jgi:hypothetical protein